MGHNKARRDWLAEGPRTWGGPITWRETQTGDDVYQRRTNVVIARHEYQEGEWGASRVCEWVLTSCQLGAAGGGGWRRRGGVRVRACVRLYVCGRVIHLRPPLVPFISARVFVCRPIAALGMWIGMWLKWRLGEGRPVLLLIRERRRVCRDRCRSPRHQSRRRRP